MFEAIRAIIAGKTTAGTDDTPAGVDPVQVAACALLLEIAYADGEFSAPERAHLEEVLARHFGLDAETGARLLAIAHEERAQAVDHFRFTSVLLRNYDIGHIGLGVNGGGVASLNAVGGNAKAQGCTGLPTPVGDFVGAAR